MTLSEGSPARQCPGCREELPCLPGLSHGGRVVGPDKEFTREAIRKTAARYHNDPPVPSSNPIIGRLQKGSEWGPIANLTSPQAAVDWVRSRSSGDWSRPSVKTLFRLRIDWRLTPESRPMLLDILSSEDKGSSSLH